jgi:surface antigen
MGHYLNRRLARDLAPDDQALHDAAAASALWSHTKGYGETWHGRDGRTSGTIIPTSRVETVDGALCRQFHDSVVLPGEAVFGVDGTACLKGQAWTVDF